MACVFCEIVAGAAPAVRVYEDDDYLGLLDIRPFTRGHTLVIPKEHTVDLTDTPAPKLAGLLTQPAAKIAMVLQAPGGQVARVINAYAEKGEAA